mmetsp:Transcript_84702/g.213589  ORF Transcript_84702/g.213589 Transcript_84702/m.213589 type:complete len:91 (+) Transcript_84702:710-982(+)
MRACRARRRLLAAVATAIPTDIHDVTTATGRIEGPEAAGAPPQSVEARRGEEPLATARSAPGLGGEKHALVGLANATLRMTIMETPASMR